MADITNKTPSEAPYTQPNLQGGPALAGKEKLKQESMLSGASKKEVDVRSNDAYKPEPTKEATTDFDKQGLMKGQDVEKAGKTPGAYDVPGRSKLK
ncbi:hypothetical protein QOT17_019180 [Balamuthia mandrillaris]